VVTPGAPEPEFQPWTPETEDQVERELPGFIDAWNRIGQPPTPGTTGDPFLRSGVEAPRPFLGRAQDILDANISLYAVHKNLQQYRGFLEDEFPEQYDALTHAKSRAYGDKLKLGTLSPTASLYYAWQELAEEYPYNYTQMLGTDFGLAKLWEKAVQHMGETPNYAHWELNPNQFSLSDFGGFLTEVERQQMPDTIPGLKDVTIKATEILADPIFIGTLALLPPAGALQKAKLGLGIAAGMAGGEEAAEATGAPPAVGALAGAFAGVGVVGGVEGFTRAMLRNGGRRALDKPVWGEPATEAMVRTDAIIRDPRVINRELGIRTALDDIPTRSVTEVEAGADIVYTAKYIDEAEAIAAGAREGEMWTTTGIRDVSNKGTNATVLAMRVRPGATPIQSHPEMKGAQLWKASDLTPVSQTPIWEVIPTDILALGEPISRTTTAQLAAAAGGAPAMGVNTMDDMIRALITRPEANDALRRIARGMSNIPGAKRLINMVNRMALGDDPWLKGAFGWVGLKQMQDARRFMAMAPFRGGKPFQVRKLWIENDVGQIWMPKQAGQPSNFLARGRPQNGDWVAVGDVFESVMRGEQTYLKRLTTEQVDAIFEYQKVLQVRTNEVEQLLGITISKRLAHWPRFVQDPVAKRFRVEGAGRGKPTGLHARQIEEQQRAIEEYGLKYKPGVFEQMENQIAGLDRIERDAILNKYLIREGVVTEALPKGAKIPEKTIYEEYADRIGAGVRLSTKGPITVGKLPAEQLAEIMEIIGPGTRNPVVTLPGKFNSIARAVLTGTMDTGWGAIQMMTLAGLAPEKWAEAMGRGMWNMIVEPKQFYRFMSRSPGARLYADYGGSLAAESEFLEGLRLLSLPRVPYASPVVDMATFPARAFVNRLQVGFETTLAYGRVLGFEAMAEAATKPSLALRAAGARPLAGQELHDELFRLVRFTDTLLGQPKLGGVLGQTQQQIESAFVWFATRYTRSFLGTMSYLAGTGYAPAQARMIMAKMLMGGAATMSGLIAAKGFATGKSQREILNEIKTSLNPASGKKHMSMNIGGSWYGLGGVYRSGMAVFAGMADKKNWQHDSWEEWMVDNPIVRGWRSRTAPVTSRFMDWLTGEDYLGYEVPRDFFFDDPRALIDYLSDAHAPIAVDAYLEGRGDWYNRLPATMAEFVGLRTSPDTAWEIMSPVMDRVSTDRFGVPYADLEHNMPARDWVQNHPHVQAVAEGEVRPLRERPEEKRWRIYNTDRDAIRTTTEQGKAELEAAFLAGNMTGREYTDRYRELNSQQFFELRGMRGGMGIEFDDEDAPAGSIDAILDAYYDIQLEDYTPKATLQPDWEAYFAARGAVLRQVPPEYEDLIQTWLSRNETELRRNFRERFEADIEPTGYLRMREVIAAQLDVDLGVLEEYVATQLKEGEARAAPVDIARVIDKALNERLGEVAEGVTMDKIKKKMRETNPVLDLELYRQGFATTVRSNAAIELARYMMEKHPDRGYFLPRLAADAPDSKKD
jgi:hypothetical protein